MKRIRKNICTILSVFLICAVVFNDGALMNVLASNFDNNALQGDSSEQNPVENNEDGAGTGTGDEGGTGAGTGDEGGTGAGTGDEGGTGTGTGDEGGTGAGTGDEGGTGAGTGDEGGTGAGTGDEGGTGTGEGDEGGTGTGEGDEGGTGTGEGDEGGTGTGEGDEGGTGTGEGDEGGTGAGEGDEGGTGTGEGDEGGTGTGEGDEGGTGAGEGDEGGIGTGEGDEEEHTHTWIRQEDSIFPVCSECGEIYHDDDCISEEAGGVGIHIFELIQVEGEPDKYRCTICGYEKDSLEEWEAISEEHTHTWIRQEDSIFPVCSECGEIYHDDDCWSEEEGGIGIHIFELIQEEGKEDIYRCAICGYEKSFLEEWEVTLEMYMELEGIATFSNDFMIGGILETSYFPTTVAELQAELTAGHYAEHMFNITKLADLMALQMLSEDGFDFKDWTVQFGVKENTGSSVDTNWDLRLLAGMYHGLGTESAPFKGTMTNFYKNGSVQFYTSMPMLNYVASGATVSEFNILSDITGSGDPVGIIAAHVVQDEDHEKVNLSKLILGGTVRNAGGSAGLIFGEAQGSDKALKMEYSAADDSIQITAIVNAKDAGGIVGKTTGNVEVYSTNPITTGTVAGLESAGMLAGLMETDGKVYIGSAAGDCEVAAKVSGAGICGGLVGIVREGEVRNADDGKKLTVSGTVSGGIAAGGIIGKCENTDIHIKNVQVSAGIAGTAVGSSLAGGVIGSIISGAEGNIDDAYDSIDQVSVTGLIATGKSLGGIVGEINGSNIRIGESEGVSVTGSLTNGTYGTAIGGIVGAATGQFIEVKNAQVGPNTLLRAQSMGGVFGTVGDGTGRSVVKVENVTIMATADQYDNNNRDRAQGGIFGTVKANSMAALDGTIDIHFSYANAPYMPHNDNHHKTGYIAGAQEEALIYFEEGAAYTHEQRRWYDDIGSYGGVYRNGNWGEGSPLISYAEKQVNGTVGSSGGGWSLDTEADVIRLAMALNTEGRFAGSCFGQDKSALLQAEYHLANRIYALADSGIYALNRNDTQGSNEAFTGKFYGGRARLQLGSYDTFQPYVALFPRIGEGAVFDQLTIEGKDGSPRQIRYAQNGAAGLAVYGEGNVTVTNVNINTAITGSALHNPYLYGGMIARFTAPSGTTLTVENSSLSGGIILNQVNLTTANMGSRQYAGGMIAQYDSTAQTTIRISNLNLNQRINSSSRLVSGMITQINSSHTGEVQDKTILDLSNITVNNGAELRVTDNVGVGGTTEIVSGGFLGREWFDVMPYKAGNYSIKNLTVGAGDGAVPVLAFGSYNTFGGMIHTVTGRIQLVDTKINGINVNGGANNNALLINNGYNALVEIDGYDINSANTTIAGVGSFSEIVGRNIGTAPNDNNYNYNYACGGVVNIISSDFANNSQVYKDQKVSEDTASGRVRYYYNLFGTSLAGEDSFLNGRELDGSALTIKDADQMLIWHLSQYMNDSIRKKYLAPYFTGGSVPARNGDVTLQGTIDLENKSYYPTPVDGMTINGGGAEIRFKADVIESKADAGRKPSRQGEHYMMHSGLFLSRTGAVTVQGNMRTPVPGSNDYLTLSGTVANIGAESGALFSRVISGTKNIYRIKLKDLYIDQYASDHDHGLMIAKITDRDHYYNNNNYYYNPVRMDMSWITTEYTLSGKKAASALIGQVGDPDGDAYFGSRDIEIDFTNMKLDDATNGIFQNATFIDQHYYTDDTEKNRGRVRYLFTEGAAQGKNGAEYAPFQDDIHGRNSYLGIGKYITIGNELQYGVEYWDEVPFTESTVEGELGVADWGAYLPYVCKTHDESKEIEVNPKTFGMIEGCGTYEDPYVITKSKQILALARYLTNPLDRKYLEGWTVNKIGNNGSYCSGSHTEVKYSIVDGKVIDTFPTQDQLRQAYYRIAEDIDLSSLASSTDRNIAQEFVGLGTAAKPFAGVIVGKKKVDGTFPKITLPHKNTRNNTTNFGFIQYAKGAVVKDLIITGRPSVRDTLTDIICVRENAGTVFACVLGGDNIIDNVTVSNRIYPVGTGTAVGGYVGTVQQGSVILRGMDGDEITGFKCLVDRQGSSDDLKLEEYPYISGIVGKVENGFVMYEGTFTRDAVLDSKNHGATNIGGVYNHAKLPLSRTYDIVVAGHADMASAKTSKMTISKTGSDYSCTISTAAQLQVVSMAINSDAFSVYYDGGGYDKNAVCRKAKYDKVGQCANANEADRQEAINKDDYIYYYPYIYDYFDGVTDGGFTRLNQTLDPYTNADGESGYRSNLNAVTKDVTAKMTYSLEAGRTYDLSAYSRAFRGLGATYRVFSYDRNGGYTDDDLAVRTDSIYSDFRADFNGNGATVHAEMINDYEKSIHTTALFNDLVNTDAQNTYTIQDLTVTGTFRNWYDASLNGTADDSKNNASDNNYRNDRTAAVVGMMRRSWGLKNITVENVKVEGQGNTAGIVAWINPGNEASGAQKAYTIENCKITGTSAIETNGGSCGGIVGIMSPTKTGTLTGLSLKLNNCRVNGIDETQRVEIVNRGTGMPAVSNDQYKSGKGRAGGLVGFIGKRTSQNNDNGIKVIINWEIVDADPGSNTVAYVNIDGYDNAGGILGEYFGHSRTDSLVNSLEIAKIEGVSVAESSITGKNWNETTYGSSAVGGILGKLGRSTGCKITNAKVTNSDIKATISDSRLSSLRAGGVVGSCYSGCRLTLENVTVEGKVDSNGRLVNEISSYRDVGGLVGVTVNHGGISFDPGQTLLTVKECTVKNMKIQSDNRSDEYKASDKASGTTNGMVGGMLGAMWRSTVSIVGDGSGNLVENCIIRTGTGGSAGGIAGQLVNSRYTGANIKVAKSKIGYNGAIGSIGETNMYGEDYANGAGGIIGRSVRVDGNSNSRCALQKTQVEECTIFGKCTGGLVGYIINCQELGNIYQNTGDDIFISLNKIYGQRSGGAVGFSNTGIDKICFEHVKIQDNHILAFWNRGNEYCYAGGFTGDQRLPSSNNDFNQITIERNQIMGCNTANINNESAGGVFGILHTGNRMYAYETQLTDNHIGYYKAGGSVSDSYLGNGENQLTEIEQLLSGLGTETDVDKSAHLLRNNGTVSAENTLPTPATLKNCLHEFAYRFGTFVGVYEDNLHAYFIKPTVEYTDTYTGMRPVVDVGYLNRMAAGNGLLDSPYAYRRNVHIIYYEPDTSSGNTAADRWDAEKDYLFSEINMDKIMEQYREAMGDGGSVKQILDAYRLNIVNDGGRSVEEVYSKVYYGADEESAQPEYRSPFSIGTQTLPMIVLDAQYGTANQLLNNVLAALTGSGGVMNSGEAQTSRNNIYDSGLGGITQISLQPMKVENGVVAADPQGKPSLVLGQNTDNRRDFAYTNHYDIVDANGNGTFTMLTVTYGRGNYTPVGGSQKARGKVEIKIPVFVVERLTIDTYVKLMEGAAYNVDTAKEKGIYTDPVLATDSSYTMYVEYIYGEARDRFSTDDNPLRIDKTISMTKSIQEQITNEPFAAGTILTLIDVCDSDKVYYYEVTGNETGPIHYKEFVDINGNAYVNKAIHSQPDGSTKGMETYQGDQTFTSVDTDGSRTYSDVAVEKFLIVVKVPDEDRSAGEDAGDIRKYHVTPELEDTIAKRTVVTEHTDLQVTVQPGPKIGLIREQTNISGAIDAEDKVVVNGQFRISAAQEYWNRVLNNPDSVIDSANHGKFLELGLYLTNPADERIPLPNNTNVKIYLERLNPLGEVIQPDKNLGSYNEATEVYLYKDGELQFPLDDLRKLIEEEKRNDPNQITNGNVTMSFRIELDFEFADLTDYVLENREMYGVHLELLRAEEADYPADGDMIEDYTQDCPGAKQSDLACAIETLDLMQLGINTYDNQTVGEQFIDFRFKLDFTGVWGNNVESNRKNITDKYYTITYRILEKTNRNGNPVYRPYTGDQLEISLVNNKNQAGIEQILTPGVSSVGNELNSKYVTYQFAYSEIEDGTNKEAERVITRDLQLKVKNAANMDLSNYKIQASVLVSDADPHDIDSEVNRVLSDFFVFTIAKLKTDLDY